MKIVLNSSVSQISSLAAVELLSPEYPVTVEWGTANALYLNDDDKKAIVSGSNDILRALARTGLKAFLYGSNPVESTFVDHWLTFNLSFQNDVKASLQYLDKSLGALTYLVGDRLTIADLAVFDTVLQSVDATKIGEKNVQRWTDHILSLKCTQKAVVQNKTSVLNERNQLKPLNASAPAERKKEGKFVDLPGAEMGKVVVRFPPEASGYLHIGHAKAALLNQYYQQAFDGKLIMRFDDTNPAKETIEFENVILEDLKMLEIKPDLFTHTSQYFDLMLGYCETMLKEGKAYVDDTEAEQMKLDREQKIESVHRNNSPEKNFEMWNEMLKGSERGQKCCVRAKIDMSSANGCMRDPTIYRCKNEPHPRTGTQYKVYPTYDFACPIVDAIENVTHTLRTTEYHDRDDQFYWFIDALKLRKPYIWEYSRLNMTNTVLSKRKLTWFVNSGLVDGWDDPRFPTVRGILRRGMTVKGLKEFIIAQGSSKAVVFMEWDKIWAFNKKVIDPIAPRHTALEKDVVPVTVAGVEETLLKVPLHPKNADIGEKEMWIGPNIVIEAVDAELLNEGEFATFINWGNMLVDKVTRVDGKVTAISVTPRLDNKDFKKTLKLTWLCVRSTEEFAPVFCVYFQHIIEKPVLAKNEDFKDFISKDSRVEVPMFGCPALMNCRQGEIIQLTRKGFFRVDKAYEYASEYTGMPGPIVLFEIPDGHTKEKSVAGPPKKKGNVAAAVPASTSPNTSDLAQIEANIVKQGDTVRDLKAAKASKADIDAAVKSLLALKADYKAVAGADWKPSAVANPVNTKATANATQPSAKVSQSEFETTAIIHGRITRLNAHIAKLQEQKSQAELETAQKYLIALKTEFTRATGLQYTAPPPTPSYSEAGNILSAKIDHQGDLVRELKRTKAAKAQIDSAVKVLLDLKAEFKQETKVDWKQPPVVGAVCMPGVVLPTIPVPVLSGQIAKQGDLVRDLKAKKAAKADIEEAVKTLLALKTDFKTLTGLAWTPELADIVPPPIDVPTWTPISENIVKQGDLVRELKSKKAPKADIDAAVKLLLSLKTDYKTATGLDWTPPAAPTPATTTSANMTVSASNSDELRLNASITAQGNLVRDLKAKKAAKPEIDDAVKGLLALKAEFKSITGNDWKPSAVASTPAAPAQASVATANSDEVRINDAITVQGNLVRDLKAKKAAKPEIDEAVKGLLALKAEYKSATGKDWKPSTVAPTKAAPAPAPANNSEETRINEAISVQGNLVRDLKSKKAVKPEIDAAVKALLSLKAEFKLVTGKEWKPSTAAPVVAATTVPAAVASNSEEARINEAITSQGNLVRDLKAKKAGKGEIDEAVKKLLALKSDFKAATGTDWKPSAAAPTSTPSAAPASGDASTVLTEKITAQGNVVRSLKASGGSADDVMAAVDVLTTLKAEYKTLTGTDFPTGGRGPAKPKAEPKAKAEPKPKPAPKAAANVASSAAGEDKSGVKKQTRLGLEARKSENLPEWYSQIITKSEMIEYYDVSGCYILRPWSIAIWRTIQNFFQDEITKLGVKECYFPMFVSKAALEKEKDHIADFSPEVAWVTKSGDSDLAEPIAIRPTSETIMYPAFAKWIQSYRDLPLKLNQWSNVVRWEFKHPQPFLRTREFLWQEGHTAFADVKEAEAEVLDILALYARIYEELLAIPVRRGRKSTKEKFAGGDYTTTVEAFVSASGRSIQGATSHHLGQNFSKMFDIIYEDPLTQEKKYVYQNSWGITTRTIGVMIMVHGDDKGLVIPPRVAPVQAVVVPCGLTVSTTDAERDVLLKSCADLENTLRAAGVRVEGDYRDNYSPGWKFNHWELKGTPIRIELGPKDIKSNQLVLVRRDTGDKIVVPRDQVSSKVPETLDAIQKNLFANAQKDFDEHLVMTKSWPEFCANLEKKNVLCSPFCGVPECEDRIKDESAITEATEPGAMLTGAKSLCIPFKQPADILPTDKCIHPACSRTPQFWTYFGRSY